MCFTHRNHNAQDVVPRLRFAHNGIREHTAIPTDVLERPSDIALVIAHPGSSITHDVDIKSADGTVVENEDPIPGGTEKQYQLQPLPAGTYTFFCSVHPGVAAMEGTLTVK